MGRKSSIDQLGREIREAVDAAIREGRATGAEIVEMIRRMGGDASQSAVYRYKANAEAQMQKFREAQEIAKVWTTKLTEEPEGDVARLVPEMLRVVAFNQIGSVVEGKQSVTPMETMLLAKALDHLSRSEKAHLERVLKAREEAKREAAAEVSKSAKEFGLSDRAAEQICARILGIDDDGNRKPARR